MIEKSSYKKYFTIKNHDGPNVSGSSPFNIGIYRSYFNGEKTIFNGNPHISTKGFTSDVFENMIYGLPVVIKIFELKKN